MAFGELCLVLQHQGGGGGCWDKRCSHILIQKVLKLQAKQKPATDLNFARCLFLIRGKEGKIKDISQWKSTQVSLHSGVEGLCACLCFGYSPELPSAPKTKVNKLVNYGWHIPLDFFFFFKFLLYFPSKQERAPFPLHSPGTSHNTISSPQFPGFSWKHTQTWDREVAARCLQRFYSKSIPLLGADSGQSTRVALGTPFPPPTLWSQTLVERGCFWANALGIFLERS